MEGGGESMRDASSKGVAQAVSMSIGAPRPRRPAGGAGAPPLSAFKSCTSSGYDYDDASCDASAESEVGEEEEEEQIQVRVVQFTKTALVHSIA